MASARAVPDNARAKHIEAVNNVRSFIINSNHELGSEKLCVTHAANGGFQLISSPQKNTFPSKPSFRETDPQASPKDAFTAQWACFDSRVSRDILITTKEFTWIKTMRKFFVANAADCTPHIDSEGLI